MILQLESIRLAITKILQIELINTKYFFFSLWSVIHVFSGIFLMFFIDKLKTTKTTKILTLSSILILYEMIEFWATGRFTYFFIAEDLVDALSDVAVGIVGGLIYLWQK